MPLKRESAPDDVVKIKAVEGIADQFLARLELFKHPRSLAIWAVLVFHVLKTEELQAQSGTLKLNEALLNLSRCGALVLRWLQDRASAPPAGLRRIWHLDR